MNYVLEILEGDRAGETFPLGEKRVSIGRRPDNEVVLHDEKVSGRHAEIAFEGGRFVLRDLESRNGTLLDGRRIQEVALNAFDTFQIGRTLVRLRDTEAEEPVATMQVHRVDQARLAQSRKRRGVLGLVLMLVVAGGAGAWFFLQSKDVERRRTGAAVRMPDVAGNKLDADAAHCEEEGADRWNLRVAGVGFVFGGPAHTGSSALEARRDNNPAAAAGSEGYALARSVPPLAVMSGQQLRLSGWLQTAAGGRGALRLRFHSSQDDAREALCVGTPLASHDAYEQVALDVAVPPGMDQVEVEVLALLGTEEDSVVADDLALVRDGDGSAVDLKVEARNLVGTAGDFMIKSAREPVLLGLRPLVADSALEALERADLLTLGDVGVRAAITENDAGFAVQLSGEGAAAGVTLVFPAESAAAGVLTRGDSKVFVPQAGDFALDGQQELLLGDGVTRVLVRLSEPATVRGATRGDAFRLQLQGVAAFDLVVRYPQEAERARTALREAQKLVQRGSPGAALEQLRNLLEVPHDSETAREGARLRGELLSELGKRLEGLRADLAKAEFFRISGGYERLLQRLDALVASYGKDNLPEPDAVQAMRDKVASELAELQASVASEQRQRLQQMADVFRESGDTALAEMVKTYVDKHLKGN